MLGLFQILLSSFPSLKHHHSSLGMVPSLSLPFAIDKPQFVSVIISVWYAVNGLLMSCCHSIIPKMPLLNSNFGFQNLYFHWDFRCSTLNLTSWREASKSFYYQPHMGPFNGSLRTYNYLPTFPGSGMPATRKPQKRFRWPFLIVPWLLKSIYEFSILGREFLILKLSGGN